MGFKCAHNGSLIRYYDGCFKIFLRQVILTPIPSRYGYLITGFSHSHWDFPDSWYDEWFFIVSWLLEVLFQKYGSYLNIVSVGLLWHQAFGNNGTLRLNWQVEVKAQVPHLTHFDKRGNWGGVGWNASLQSWGFRLPTRTLHIPTCLRGRGLPPLSSLWVPQW